MNTDRDWLYVEDWWTVYGVIDPLSKCICYVGITNGPLSKRFNQHRSDRNSAVWELFDDVRQRGAEIEYCVLATVKSEKAARHLESALIIILPQIFNRTHCKESEALWRPYANTPFVGVNVLW